MKRIRKSFEPGLGYTKEDWEAVEGRTATDAELKQAKPFAQAFPELADKMRKNLGGRPKLDKPKRSINIRLDQEVIEKFRATGPGWHTRINEVLRKAKLP